MRKIDGDALLERVQNEKIQAQVHGREFSTCFMSPGGTPSTEWWYVEDLIENAPTIEPEIIHCRDCKWWEKQEKTLQGWCFLMQMYPTGAWFCGNAQKKDDADMRED